jgi:hypothetical protein
MARITVFFVLCMTLDDLAGHDQGLDLGMGRLGNDEGESHQCSG